MMGTKERAFAPLPPVSLEELVPADHFYRHSERQLMRVVADRLSLRWYLGYDLMEPLPDHSSLTRIRDRYGLDVFCRFFEAITEQCVAAGLVWGQELFIDSTNVEANASLDSLRTRFAVGAHLARLF